MEKLKIILRFLAVLVTLYQVLELVIYILDYRESIVSMGVVAYVSAYVSYAILVVMTIVEIYLLFNRRAIFGKSTNIIMVVLLVLTLIDYALTIWGELASVWTVDFGPIIYSQTVEYLLVLGIMTINTKITNKGK